jgi:hypothetical protein
LPSYPGIFNGQTQAERAPLQFLHRFVRECTQPIAKDGSEHIDYIPTQVVTEFFRHIFTDTEGKRLDGILYPSSKRNGGICCVLFCLNENCTEDNKPIERPYEQINPLLSLETFSTEYRTLPL